MSGRPWVKLATKLHTDPAMMTIPREALGNWCLCLSLAGANDDDGRLGTVAEVAWHLRLTEADVTGLVDTMRGRLAIVDGIVTVRDWCQWQPPRDVTNAKRQAEHRARKAVTESNDVTPVTVTALDIEVEVEEEEDTETDSAPPAQEIPPPEPPTFTASVTAAISESLGGLALTAKNGKLLAWPVKVLTMLDEWTGRDADAAIALWRSFVDSSKWKFKGADPTRWPGVLGDWYANDRPLRAAPSGYDPRFYVQRDDGRYVLKDPSLVEFPAPYAAHNPATWPPDMRAAYVARIHQTANGEVFA